MEKYMEWMQNGGSGTVREFRALSMDDKLELLDYLGDFSLYEETQVAAGDSFWYTEAWNLSGKE